MRRTLLISAAVTALGAWAASGIIETDNGLIAVTPVEGNAFEVARAPKGGVIPAPKGKETRLRNWSDGRKTVYLADGYSLHVDKRSGRLSFIAENGDTLLTESGPLSFSARKGTSFYGAGERGQSLRLNGDSLVQWNRPNYGYGEGDKRLSQMGITMPYLLSDAGFGLLFNDDSRSLISFPASESFVYESENPRAFSYTFTGGKGMPEVTSNFTKIAGRQDLPPFWALGYITSKYGYRSAKEALGAVDSLKNHGYPVDGLILDLYWYGKETDMGRLEWNPVQFPDPKGMLDSLNGQGVHTVLIHQPYINKTGALDNYNMLNDAGLLTHGADGKTVDVHTWVGDAGMFDISNPDTREWLWNRLRTIGADGVSGWWGDLGEPEVHPLDIVHANGLKARDYHNRYGNDWSAMVYNGLRADFPTQRPFVMMRGGTTGLQQYSVFPWTGDVARSWRGLQPQVKLLLNSGLSGLGYMSSDIGGFAVDAKHPYDPELYVRWMQLGVFNPVLRTHAQNQPEPYHYPKQEKLLRDLVKMRYEWLPYNYTLAYENSSDGQPLARPVNYYGTTDRRFANVEDEYLWGSEVLVAPVMTQGARSRKVLFPDLSEKKNSPTVWVDWFNPLRSYRGGSQVSVPVTLEKFPLFVKKGSFIPLYARAVENVGDYDPKYLTVKYFASNEPSSYTLFDDDRKNPESLKENAYQLTTFSADGKGNYSIEATGSYAGMPAERDITLEFIGVSKPLRPTVDGKAAKVTYSQATRTATLTVSFTGQPLRIALK